MGSPTSSASSDEEDFAPTASEKGLGETTSPVVGVLARRKVRLQQQRNTQAAMTITADEPKPACDDVSTGMQDSHEIWEEGREGIEIAKVAREHGLDVPTARIVQQKLEQERRKSAGLRTLSANSQIMSGFEAVTASETLQRRTDQFPQRGKAMLRNGGLPIAVQEAALKHDHIQYPLDRII